MSTGRGSGVPGDGGGALAAFVSLADVFIHWAVPRFPWASDHVSLRRLVEPRGERRHHLRVPALGVDVAHLDEVDRLDGGGAPEFGDLRLDVPAAEAVLEGVGVDLRDEEGQRRARLKYS